MDYLSYNRAHLNNRRIHHVDDKIMIFIVPSIVQVGVVRTELRFPYRGTIFDAYVTCGTTGATRTVVDIEKCSQTNYDTNPVWESIFTNKLMVDGNHKSNRTSLHPYTIKAKYVKVHEDDHFRLHIKEVGANVKDITVELVVKLEMEET